MKKVNSSTDQEKNVKDEKAAFHTTVTTSATHGEDQSTALSLKGGKSYLTERCILLALRGDKIVNSLPVLCCIQATAVDTQQMQKCINNNLQWHAVASNGH